MALSRRRLPADDVVELAAVSGSYAYLVVEQKWHVLMAEEDPDQVEDKPTPVTGSFSDGLRSALEASARQAGYGSFEALMGSRRSLEKNTPARAKHVKALVAAELMNEQDDAVAQLLRGTVPDAAWHVLGGIDPARGTAQPVPDLGATRAMTASRKTVNSWSLTLQTADEAAPIEVDPHRFPARALPAELVLKTLDRLAQDGWAVVHLSEDRSINDDASASVVTRQRFLLHR